jgi:hypothetical protein
MEMVGIILRLSIAFAFTCTGVYLITLAFVELMKIRKSK